MLYIYNIKLKDMKTLLLIIAVLLFVTGLLMCNSVDGSVLFGAKFIIVSVVLTGMAFSNVEQDTENPIY